MKYEKPPKTLDEQINLLEERGLIFGDKDEAKECLKNISYYHLSIYFKFYQKRDNTFFEDVSFEKVWKLYLFDKGLKLLLLNLLERIEKSFKCRMAYEISIDENNSHWFLDKSLFKSEAEYEENVEKIFLEELEKNKNEQCVNHYTNTYTIPPQPPIWTLIEILSFGQCVRMTKYLKRPNKNKIAKTYGVDEKFLLNWMQSLSFLRNLCAHHSRLWNRNFLLKIKKDHRDYSDCFVDLENDRLYSYLVVLQIVLSKINPTSSWLEKLKRMIETFEIEISYMGFPEDWYDKLKKISLRN